LAELNPHHWSVGILLFGRNVLLKYTERRLNMVAQPVPGVTLAVESFLAYFRQLRYMPFLSDAEIVLLYGPEVNSAIMTLDFYNQQQHICGTCQYHCCRRVKCEFYDPAFTCCPVEPYRPALCRLHYCDRFCADYGLLVKALGDIYLESLLVASRLDASRAALFDCPAFAPLDPHLTVSIQTALQLVKLRQKTHVEVFPGILHLIEERTLKAPGG
jgi:hypothetical protein